MNDCHHAGDPVFDCHSLSLSTNMRFGRGELQRHALYADLRAFSRHFHYHHALCSGGHGKAVRGGTLLIGYHSVWQIDAHVVCFL